MTLSSFLKKTLSPIVWGNCLGVVAAAGCLCFLALWFLQCYTGHGDVVTVPNLRGQRIDIAERKLQALGLRVEVTDTGYVDTYVGDVVLDQAVRPGDKVKPGRIIELTVNAASARAIAVPQLADNCSRREAEAKLRALGFKSIRTEYTDGDSDWVYRVKAGGKLLQKGERVPVTTVITLVIGNGAVDDQFNGDDSLDFVTFGGAGEEDDILESGGGESYDSPENPEAE